MNKKKARRLIEELQSTLSKTSVNQQFWMDKVRAYIQAIFGDHTQSIALPMYETYYGDKNPKDAERTNYFVEKLEELFETYLVMIDNGVFIRKNVFSNFNNWQVIGIVAAILIAVTSGLTGIAFIEGQRTENIYKQRLETKIESLNIKLKQCEEERRVRN